MFKLHKISYLNSQIYTFYSLIAEKLSFAKRLLPLDLDKSACASEVTLWPPLAVVLPGEQGIHRANGTILLRAPTPARVAKFSK